ncbi:MAG: FGGY family carbohydrate kinase [Chloroflexota bacterium]|nr:FGGY family carbohydrate kinase [Chloroflexota bacterium]
MKDAMKYVMALDAGTGAGRCFLVSLDGQQSFEKYQEWQYEFLADMQPVGAEFNPEVFWGIFADLIRRTLAENGISPDQVVGVSSTSQREGIVLLDQDGRELYAGPNIDMRAPSDWMHITTDFGQDIYQVSGHWPFPMFAPYRLLWFKEHKPELYERVHTMLLLNDWILYRLSGARASEPSNATETLLFDLGARDWAMTLIERLGLPDGIYPPVFASGTQIGKVSQEAAAATGLKAGTPVVTGGGDTQCALLGTGAIEDGEISTVLGTYAPSQLVVDQPIIDPQYRAWGGCHVVPNKWVVESTAMEAGQAFRWTRDVFYGGGGPDAYSVMDAEAVVSPIGARGVQAFVGSRVSNYRSLAFAVRGAFFFQLPPLPGSASRGDFARAVLESIAYGVRANVERLQRVSGRQVSKLRVCGGVSKSQALPQILADMLSVPVLVPELTEGSAMGAALCAAVGSGYVNSFGEAVAAMVHWNRELAPDPDRVEAYQVLYEQWLELAPQVYGPGVMGEV